MSLTHLWYDCSFLLTVLIQVPDAETHPSFLGDLSTAALLDSDANQLAPHKVHLRGLDNLTSADVETFASKYFPIQPFEKIEWIDDTSANLVYQTPELASQAFAAFAEAGVDEAHHASHLHLFPAKPLPMHPELRLQVRLAVLGDKKQAGARERSRFYLFNPDYDPSNRRKREGHRKRYRDRDDGRQGGQENEEVFDASLYDDDEVTRALRASTSHSRQNSGSSISSGEYRGLGVRKIRHNGGRGKELFPERMKHRHSGARLRDRSASPLRDSDGVRDMKSVQSERSDSSLHRAKRSTSANRIQAQLIKTVLKEASNVPKELFPEKPSSNHRRSDAFDASDATADLFASKMTTPFLDGTSDTPPRENDLRSRRTKTTIEHRINSAGSSDRNGFNIRGAAEEHQDLGISIKGTATVSTAPVKELFPYKIGLNSGKELFAEKLEGRGGRRRRAEDMFY